MPGGLGGASGGGAARFDASGLDAAGIDAAGMDAAGLDAAEPVEGAQVVEPPVAPPPVDQADLDQADLDQASLEQADLEQTSLTGAGPGATGLDGVTGGLIAGLPQAPPAGSGIDPAERTPRSFHLSRRLLERARAAAYCLGQLPGVHEATNVSELVERALAAEVERLERDYNGGEPFPAVLGKMRTGPGASGVERIRRAQRARRRPT